MKGFSRLVMAIASIVIFMSSQVAAFERPYRVAVIIPLTGPVASLGDYVKKGLTLAYDRLSPAERQKIELIFEDDQFDPKQTIAIYQRLSLNRPIDAVFVLGSPTANAIGPITEKNKTLLVAIGASDPNIILNRQYSFIHWVIPSVLGKRLASELIRRGFKKIAFVTAEVTGAFADRDGVIDSLKELGEASRIVYDQSFEKTVTDYRSAITAIKAKNSDAVVLALFPGALSSFTKQARQLGLAAEITGVETFEDDSEVKASAGTLVGKWYVNGADPTSEFTKIFKDAYGINPGWASANSYDALNLLNAAIKASNKDNDSISAFWKNLKDYSGAAGKYSASGDNRFTLPASLKRVTETGFVTIEKSDQ